MRLKNDAVFQVVGPSGSGKTIFVAQLLAKSKHKFQHEIKHIYWLMGTNEGEKGETKKQFAKLSGKITILQGFEDG